MVKVARKWLQFTDHWLEGQWGPVIALFSFPRIPHPNPSAVPTSCQVCSYLVQTTIYHELYLSIMCTPLSIPVFHSLFFIASCFRRTSFPLLEGCPSIWPLILRDSACSFSFSFFLTTMYRQSLPLHRLKESWVSERSSNWSQHLSPSFTSLKRRSTFLNLWVPHELLQVLFFLCF